jgi:hypothetical protein
MKSAFNSPETAARVAAGLCIEVLIRATVCRGFSLVSTKRATAGWKRQVVFIS